MTISIVVPAFNEEKLLADSLRSIQIARRAFDDAGWTSELIVCDNNSTDRTAAIAAAAGAIVVFEPINQIGRARNAGAARATGDWLLFIDADSYPTRALFEDVVRTIQQGDCLAGGSTVAIDVDNRHFQRGIAAWNRISRAMKWAAGSFIFCDASAFKEVGGFSLRLYASEELDLFRRLKKLARRRGKRIVILQDHPLLTSGRKAELYSHRELALFWIGMVASAGLALRSAKGSFMWYDGRR